MKAYLLLLTLFTATIPGIAQPPRANEFSLSGNLKGSPSKMIYLGYKGYDGKNVQDSFALNNGNFSFKGRINEPTTAVLKTTLRNIPDDENLNIAQVFLEPTTMTANIENDKFGDLVLTGSAIHSEFWDLRKQHALINEKYKDSLAERHGALSESYILNHRSSFLSAYELSGFLSRWPNGMVQYLYGRLDEKVRENKYGKQIKAYFDDLKANSEGRPAKEFIATDVRGKSLSLSDLKGKYVLLDFWGSWCTPCRASHPHLKELYKQYADKGFEIVGISTEYNKTDAAWKEAIQKDRINMWHHVLSTPLAGSPDQPSKEIADSYAVHVFPTKILIDPCGFIIARIDGSDKEGKLDEILKTIYR